MCRKVCKSVSLCVKRIDLAVAIAGNVPLSGKLSQLIFSLCATMCTMFKYFALIILNYRNGAYDYVLFYTRECLIVHAMFVHSVLFLILLCSATNPSTRYVICVIVLLFYILFITMRKLLSLLHILLRKGLHRLMHIKSELLTIRV